MNAATGVVFPITESHVRVLRAHRETDENMIGIVLPIESVSVQTVKRPEPEHPRPTATGSPCSICPRKQWPAYCTSRVRHEDMDTGRVCRPREPRNYTPQSGWPRPAGLGTRQFRRLSLASALADERRTIPSVTGLGFTRTLGSALRCVQGSRLAVVTVASRRSDAVM